MQHQRIQRTLRFKDPYEDRFRFTPNAKGVEHVNQVGISLRHLGIHPNDCSQVVARNAAFVPHRASPSTSRAEGSLPDSHLGNSALPSTLNLPV
jgi:hypothetical protein